MRDAETNRRQNPGSTEVTMGMKLFITGTRGTGGKLRKRTEDFVVVENSLFPAKAEPADDAKFAVATVRAFNWETNRLVKVMARSLGIRKTKIHFAGTKSHYHAAIYF